MEPYRHWGVWPGEDPPVGERVIDIAPDEPTYGKVAQVIAKVEHPEFGTGYKLLFRDGKEAWRSSWGIRRFPPLMQNPPEDPRKQLLAETLYNPFSPHSEPGFLFMEGDEPLAEVSLSYNPNIWGDMVHIASIHALSKGGGRKVMEMLGERADAIGVTLTGVVRGIKTKLYPRAWGKKRLVQWYKQFRFVEKPPGSGHIFRYPKT